MPAGRGNKCEACALRAKLERRSRLSEAAFATPVMTQVFRAFGDWLPNEVGLEKAALTLPRYLPFFTEMERRWGTIPAYEELVTHFSAEGLRRVRVPMRFLGAVYGVTVDPVVREHDSERRRVEALLALTDDAAASELISAYHDGLCAREASGRTSLRSVRLALRPAVDLIRLAGERRGGLPDQGVLDLYLRSAPGQRAAVSGFVAFLNRRYDMALVPRVDGRRIKSERRAEVERQVIAFLANAESGDPDIQVWLRLALLYFHDLKVGQRDSLEHVATHADGSYTVLWQEQSYWIPNWRT